LQPGLFAGAELRNPDPVVGTADHRTHGDDDAIEQVVRLGALDPWVVHRCEKGRQGKVTNRGHGEPPRIQDACFRIMPHSVPQRNEDAIALGVMAYCVTVLSSVKL
jgi:hypothetical protein